MRTTRWGYRLKDRLKVYWTLNHITIMKMDVYEAIMASTQTSVLVTIQKAIYEVGMIRVRL